MKVPEYMATGLAVVAPRTPNLRDLIVDGEDGALFDGDDVSSLAATIGTLIDDARARARLGENARRTIVSRRTWDHNASRVLEFMTERRACA
jgi:glycosyltransferase involved in cell wall biosynthesis